MVALACICMLFAPLLAAGEAAVVAIAGSTTTETVTRRIARDYMKTRRDIRVEVAGGGSASGLEDLLLGRVDIANSSRFITNEEVERALQRGVYPVPFHIADDCIIPIVHKSNKLKNLSIEQLRRVYLGEIRSWRELGGADRKVVPISREKGSGTHAVWRDVVMGGLSIPDSSIRKSTGAEVVRAVLGQPGAIGYVSLGHLSANLKPLRVQGVMGSLYTLRDGSYPLSRPLYMFTRGWPQDSTLAFINYMLNPDQGQLVLQKSGFIPVHLHSNH